MSLVQFFFSLQMKSLLWFFISNTILPVSKSIFDIKLKILIIILIIKKVNILLAFFFNDQLNLFDNNKIHLKNFFF